MVSIAGVCDDGCVVGGGRVVKCVLGGHAIDAKLGMCMRERWWVGDVLKW